MCTVQAADGVSCNDHSAHVGNNYQQLPSHAASRYPAPLPISRSTQTCMLHSEIYRRKCVYLGPGKEKGGATGQQRRRGGREASFQTFAKTQTPYCVSIYPQILRHCRTQYKRGWAEGCGSHSKSGPHVAPQTQSCILWC